jgi:hypothetical protein
MLMIKHLLILLFPVLLFSCKEQAKPRIDLAKLTFKETARMLVNYDNKVRAGVNTAETLAAIIVSVKSSGSYAFNGIPLDSTEVMFQLNSPTFRNDTVLHDGSAQVISTPVKNDRVLDSVIRSYKADSVIYGYRIGIKTAALKARILKELTKLYGTGTKNPNIDNGLYWNLKNQQRLILYAPDYQRLVVLNTTNLSKTCYNDNITGTLDFGGCNIKQYVEELYPIRSRAFDNQ